MASPSPGPACLTLVSGSAQCLGVLICVLDRVSQGTTELEVLAGPRILLAAQSVGLGVLTRGHWNTLAGCAPL